MFTLSPIVIAVLVIVFILIFDRIGRYLQKASPEILKWIDYGSFVTIIVSGFLLYGGTNSVILRYLFLLSIIVYFIALRHSIYEAQSKRD